MAAGTGAVGSGIGTGPGQPLRTVPPARRDALGLLRPRGRLLSQGIRSDLLSHGVRSDLLPDGAGANDAGPARSAVAVRGPYRRSALHHRGAAVVARAAPRFHVDARRREFLPGA